MKPAHQTHKQISFSEKYKNKRGEQFEYVIYRVTLDPRANYRLHSIQVKHAQWGYRSFTLYTKKSAIRTQEEADLLATTEAVGVVKKRLNQATSDGFPMTFTDVFDGWWLL